ncbi:ACT domain-containing protein [Enterococcus sp. BWB1-3]|uniref:ACT domain-containing protein n=1 Tax=unclassified Enterococcus TaxID=2608891 RepID=UPI001924568A|nr:MULTISPECIES: ACT domain-containing protein [unclassified Enterococcus]MBL1229063.1 ACT domain-containing protein [Enterococcus sp. BWB1-3]MCB5953082.1 ACT domain-containing protein [Enterococcus sp. BWT-B8]MCB5955442.1 ACT domain-containing protein [Enterococcus sp. CWB-B31]
MRAVLTVIGKDKVGIIAGVSTKLAELGINILDVSQTIMDEYFTMMMILSLAKEGTNFEEIRETLNLLGNELGVKISIQNEEIFNVMHKL